MTGGLLVKATSPTPYNNYNYFIITLQSFAERGIKHHQMRNKET